MLAFDGHSTKSEAYPYNLDSYNEWGRARGQPAPVPYDEKRGLQVINMLLEAGADVSAQSEVWLRSICSSSLVFDDTLLFPTL